MDMNVILDNATLQAKSDFAGVFLPKLKDANKKCARFDFQAQGINIDELRIRMGGLSCNENSNKSYSNNTNILISIILSIIISIVIIVVIVIL